MQIIKNTQSQLDKITGFQVGITGDHNYIHRGLGYNLSGLTGSLAAGATYAISFRTPANDKYIHLRPTGISSTANTLQMRIAEGSVVTGGSAASARNRNRNNQKPSTAQITVGVTISTEGTILEYYQQGSGTKAGNASGSAGDGSAQEWVLQPDTIYTFRFENIGSSTATVGYFNLFWYEESAGVD